MKIATTIITILTSLFCFGQGLNGEIALNDDYSQKSKNVVVIDEFSYFVNQQSINSSFFTTCTLIKTDTLENIIWSSPITPQFAEYIDVMELIPSENGGVYLLGFGMPVCDVPISMFGFVQKYNSNGGLEWTKNWSDIDNYYTKLTGLSLSESNNIHINNSTPTQSKIYTIETGGTLLDSLTVEKTYLKGIYNFSNFDKIAYKEDSIFRFDTNGNVASSIRFSSEVQDLKVLNDTLYTLTSDSIFSFDLNFQEIEGGNIAGYTAYSNLKVGVKKIEIISHGLNDQFILTLNRQFTINNVLTIPVKLEEETPKDYNDKHFTTTTNFDLTRYTSIRHLDYSLQSDQDIASNSTDIGIVDIQQTQVSAIPEQGSPGVYRVKLWADVLVKNYGNKVLNECRVSHLIGPTVACGYDYYTNHFTNLNLAPNDSMWISLGLLHSNINYFSDSTVAQNICVYTSHPNFKTDLNVPNDKFCRNIVFGYVGLDENEINEVNIYPNPVSTTLNIELNNENVQFIVYDMQGILIKKGNIEFKKIDVSHLSRGIYVLHLSSKNGVLNYRKRFVVR
jgi:hypothetical protein